MNKNLAALVFTIGKVAQAIRCGNACGYVIDEKHATDLVERLDAYLDSIASISSADVQLVGDNEILENSSNESV